MAYFRPSMYDRFPGLVFEISHAQKENLFTLMSITGVNAILKIPNLPKISMEEFKEMHPNFMSAPKNPGTDTINLY